MNALPVKDQRAKLLAQAKAIATKMDQKTKLIQEAVNSREALREELAEVYVCARRLPKEELLLPKEATSVPTSFTVLESLLASAKEKGDQELGKKQGTSWETRS
eukprot:2269126-Amphidinium_carterae.1